MKRMYINTIREVLKTYSNEIFIKKLDLYTVEVTVYSNFAKVTNILTREGYIVSSELKGNYVIDTVTK